MAGPIKFEQIADLERGIQKAINDLRQLEAANKKTFGAMEKEGERLQGNLDQTRKKIESLNASFTQLDATVEKDRAKLSSLNKELGKQVQNYNSVQRAQKNLKNAQDVGIKGTQDMRNRVAQLNKELAKLRGNTGSAKKIQEVGNKAQKASVQMRQLTEATRGTAKTMRAAAGSYKALEQQNVRLRAILERLPPAFIKTNARAKQLQATLIQNTAAMRSFNASLAQSGGFLQKNGRAFNNAITGLTGYRLGTLAAVIAIRELVLANARFEDSMAEVIKTTRETDEPLVNARNRVRELAEGLKTINTRTSVTGLLNIAKAAGRFQIAAANMRDFVEAIDVVTVALRDELGEDTEKITIQLTKMAQVFGLLADGSEADAITAIGSSLNTLSNETKATAPFILDLTRRLAGVAATVDITLPFVFGLSAALDELGLTSEVSSTVLSKLFATLGKASEFKRFADLLGITTQEYKDLIASTPEQALIEVLRAAQSSEAGFGALSEVLEDLGVDGQRAGQVLTALTGNVDLLEENVQKAKDSFQEANSVLTEFDTQNTTLGASLDKLGNSIFNLATSSEGLAQYLRAIVDSLTFLLTLDFDKINSIFTSDELERDLANLVEATRGLKKPTLEAVQAFTLLNKELQQSELTRLSQNITEAKQELIAFNNQRFGARGRTQEQRNEIEVRKVQIEALINQYKALKSVFDQQREAEAAAEEEAENLTEAQKALITQYRKLVDTSREYDKALDEGETKELEKALIAAEKAAEKFRKELEKGLRALQEMAKQTQPLKNIEEIFFGEFTDPEREPTNIPRTRTEAAEQDIESLEANGAGTLDSIQRAEEIRLAKEEAAKRATIKAEKEKQAAIQETANVAIDTANYLLSVRLANIQNELRALEEQKRRELDLVGDNERARAEIEQNFIREKRELRLKEARAQKAQAIFNILLNTASAIATTIGQTGIFGIPLAAVVGALGAAQLAAVTAQPIPAFAEGGASPGGPIIVGEQGPELMQTPSGDFYKFTEPSLVDSERGAIIFNATQTRQMEEDMANQQVVASLKVPKYSQNPTEELLHNLNTSVAINNKKVVEAVKSIPVPVERLGPVDTYIDVTRRNKRTLYLSKRYRLK